MKDTFNTPKLVKFMNQEFPEYTQQEYTDFIRIFRYCIEELLLQNKRVLIRDFLTFDTRKTKPRKYATPAGEYYRDSDIIPTVKFSTVLSKRVREVSKES